MVCMTMRLWTKKREVCALVLHPSRMWLLTTVHRRLRVKISVVVVVGPGDTLAEVNRSLATSLSMMVRLVLAVGASDVNMNA